MGDAIHSNTCPNFLNSLMNFTFMPCVPAWVDIQKFYFSGHILLGRIGPGWGTVQLTQYMWYSPLWARIVGVDPAKWRRALGSFACDFFSSASLQLQHAVHVQSFPSLNVHRPQTPALVQSALTACVVHFLACDSVGMHLSWPGRSCSSRLCLWDGIVFWFAFRIATVYYVDCSVGAGILPALSDIELQFMCRGRPFHRCVFHFLVPNFDVMDGVPNPFSQCFLHGSWIPMFLGSHCLAEACFLTPCNAMHVVVFFFLHHRTTMLAAECSIVQLHGLGGFSHDSLFFVSA